MTFISPFPYDIILPDGLEECTFIGDMQNMNWNDLVSHTCLKKLDVSRVYENDLPEMLHPNLVELVIDIFIVSVKSIIQRIFYSLLHWRAHSMLKPGLDD